MILKVKKTLRKSLMFLMVFMMVINVICTILPIPSAIRYLSDIIIALMLVYVLKNAQSLFADKTIKKLSIISTVFFICALIGLVLNFYSPLLFLWGLRNIGRFFVVFFGVFLLFNREDMIHMHKLYSVIFIVNVILCFYQFLVLGLWADYIGGTFRLETQGGNTGLLWLICIETVYAFSDFINKKIDFKRFGFVAITSLIISAIAELKIFYYLFVFIIFATILLNRMSKRIVYSCIGALVGLVCGFVILQQIAPESAELLSFENAFEYVGGEEHGYSSANDLSRMRAFEQIDTMFFKDSFTKKLFGLGLGNCDVSSISFFKSPFYETYGSLNYTWFMHGMLYLETGIIGFLLYILFLIIIVLSCIKFRNKDCNNLSCYNSGIIIAIIAIIMTLYNSSLRNDTCFFVYISLALPFVQYKETIRIKGTKTSR